jgi:hypothetical protein
VRSFDRVESELPPFSKPFPSSNVPFAFYTKLYTNPPKPGPNKEVHVGQKLKPITKDR